MPQQTNKYFKQVFGASGGFHGTWPPNSKISLGDIITVDEASGVQQYVSNVKDFFNIQVQYQQSVTESDMDFSVGAQVEIKPNASAKLPVGAAVTADADVSIKLSFNTDNGFVLAGGGCSVLEITNVLPIKSAIMQSYQAGKNDGDVYKCWQKEYLVVTKIWAAETAKLVVSHKSGTSVELEGKADISAAKLKLGNVSFGSASTVTDDFKQQYIINGKCTPLYQAQGIMVPFFGKAKIAMRAFGPVKQVTFGSVPPLVNNGNATQNPAVYAVLVGIDKYPAPLPSLNGCVEDIADVENLLRQYPINNNDVYIKKLTTEKEETQPTRKNIIEAFDFFSAAEDGDTCLFYYCGHGTNLANPPKFMGDEGTGLVQALVCSDENGNRYLIDKELGYLIRKTVANKPLLNFIVVTDCCHSGSITRGALDRVGDGAEIAIRQITTSDDCPPIASFVGYHEDNDGLEAYAIAHQGEDGTLVYQGKTAPHLHFAAAATTQTAAEIGVGQTKRGVFTYSLVKLLRENANELNYQQLKNRIAGEIKSLYYNGGLVLHEQVPAVNLVGNYQAGGIFNSFLTTNNLKSLKNVEAFYDKAFGWCIRAGLIEGISEGNTVDLTTGSGTVVSTVATVFPGFSTLACGGFGADESVTSVSISGSSGFVLKIAASGDGFTEVTEKLSKLLAESGNECRADIVFTNSEQDADYILRLAESGQVYLERVGTNEKMDAKTVTVEALMADHAIEESDAFVNYLQRIANWHRVKALANKAPGGLVNGSYELFVEVAKEGQMFNGDDALYIFGPKQAALNGYDLKYLANGLVQPALKISVRNNTGEALYVSAAYLGEDFSVNTSVFDCPDLIDCNREAALLDETAGTKQDELLVSNEAKPNAITEYLKIFISVKEKIFLGSIEQSAEENTRGAGRVKKPTYAEERWQAETLALQIFPKG